MHLVHFSGFPPCKYLHNTDVAVDDLALCNSDVTIDFLKGRSLPPHEMNAQNMTRQHPTLTRREGRCARKSVKLRFSILKNSDSHTEQESDGKCCTSGGVLHKCAQVDHCNSRAVMAAAMQ